MIKLKINNIIMVSFFSLLFILFFIVRYFSLDISDSDRYFMNIAYQEAALADQSELYPVGAVLVVNGSVIAKDHNHVKESHDERDHAEMLVIKKALQTLKIQYFQYLKHKVILYTTEEPCLMCEGFIIMKNVPRVIYGRSKKPKLYLLQHFMYHFNKRGNILRQSLINPSLQRAINLV